MTTEVIPDWAIERALEVTGNPYSEKAADVRECKSHLDGIHLDFARYIMQHEKPPVDPDVELLAAIWEARGCHNVARDIRNGDLSEDDRAVIAVIKASRERWQAGAA